MLRWWFDWRPFSLWEPLGLFFERGNSGRRCWDLRTRVLQGYQTDKENRLLKDLWIITLSEIFPMNKKLLQWRKLGVFILPTLAVYLHSCPCIFTLYQHFWRSCLVFFTRFSVEEPFTSRKLLRVVIGTLPPVLRRFLGLGGISFLGPCPINLGSEVVGVFELCSQVARGPSIGPLRECSFGRDLRPMNQQKERQTGRRLWNGLVVVAGAPVTTGYGASGGSDPQQ